MRARIILTVAALLTATASLAGIVKQIKVEPVNKFTGRGNHGEELLTATVVVDGIAGGETLEALTVSVAGTTSLADVERFYATVEAADRTTLSHTEFKPKAGKDVRVKINGTIPAEGTLTVRIYADVADDAREGHRIAAELKSVEVGARKSVPASSVAASREIMLCRRLLYAPGDYGSRNWRIPALRTLPDGSLLAVNDKRKFNEIDLPHDIDIVASRSTDNGRTWSDPVTIAEGKGYKKGFGDPALTVTADGREIICVFVGGNGLWASTPDDPQRSYVSRSSDGGRTWSEPEDITPSIWGAAAENPACRSYTYSFFGSGNGLTLTRGEHAGRILFAAAMGPADKLNNHAVYSDDNGRTWHVSDLAFAGGDEAKIVELTDGRLLMSVRRNGQRGYNISSDGGRTWGEQGLWPEIDINACNGDLIRYPLKRGTLLLHSVPDHRTRRNVTIFMSRDEGRTWPEKRVVCPYESVYSSLTVLPDGTIGLYIEENPTKAGCELWFMNFSMEWLMGKPINN